MSAIAQFRAAGFRIRLISPDRIGIKPAERLTYLQRQWVIAQRDIILAELRIEAANDTAPTIQWQALIDECIMLGVTAGEVAAMFRQQDIADLCEEPAERQLLHAKTIADAIKRTRPIVAPQSPIQASVKRCIDCKHFARTDHPHLGICMAGEPRGACGNWDSDKRDYCHLFKVAP